MTVYVDNMRASFGRMVMCHMIADTEKELHAMAKQIGLWKRWYQGDHYDVSLTKRAEAVRRGAREITVRQLAMMVANRKRGLSCTPETAHAVWLAARKERLEK